MKSSNFPMSRRLLAEIWTGLGGDARDVDSVSVTGNPALPSAFAVTDLATASFGAAGLALRRLLATVAPEAAAISVDRVLASGWFHLPIGPSIPIDGARPGPVPGAMPWMTEFQTSDDRWLRVQAVFPRLRRKLVETLGVAEDPAAVGAAIRRRPGEELERELVEAGAAVALSRSLPDWRAHPQGAAVAAEPLVDVQPTVSGADTWRPTPGRPLAGIRVLDLTRVIAGPMATRFLAACGAEVLRLDAPGSDESGIAMGAGSDIVLGKRWAYLDIRTPEGRTRLLELLAGTDVLVHGYRPGAIDALVAPELRAATRPGLVEVAFNAYGWTGPWRDRRGFDSLVQYSTGLADETTRWALEDPDRRVPIVALGREVPADRPRHLPVEAVDFSTGYQVAAAAIMALARRVETGAGSVSRLSLARTARLLSDAGRAPESPVLRLPVTGPLEQRTYAAPHGPVRRLSFPLTVAGNDLFWERPYEAVGSSNPVWSSA
ncbi:CoA transferase [Pseudonocardia eucalypti]|uniref:CoA transferase n=2 Tax=Pseudonocardia eucalypti TaxID=648755 RepID=A0ABP9QJX7_9PSEU